MNISPLEEAELKADTVAMYKIGGIDNVLDCLRTMQEAQKIILLKLNEIIDEELENEKS